MELAQVKEVVALCGVMAFFVVIGVGAKVCDVIERRIQRGRNAKAWTAMLHKNVRANHRRRKVR